MDDKDNNVIYFGNNPISFNMAKSDFILFINANSLKIK